MQHKWASCLLQNATVLDRHRCAQWTATLSTSSPEAVLGHEHKVVHSSSPLEKGGSGLASDPEERAKGKEHLSGQRALCDGLVVQAPHINVKVWLSKATHACQALQDSLGNSSLGTVE